MDEVISEVKKIFLKLDNETMRVAEQTQIRCPSGCGACCLNPQVEASVLELLPLAEHLLSTRDHQELHQQLVQKAGSPCLLFAGNSETGQGRCSVYEYRPSVCRLFGYAGARNKHGAVEFSVCRVHRLTDAETVQKAEAAVKNAAVTLPLFADASSALNEVDPILANQRFSLNIALRNAIERVALFTSYRGQN